MALRIRSYLLLLLAIAATLLVLIWPQILSYGAQYALRSAQSPQMKITWSGTKGSREGVHFDSIDALLAVKTGSSARIKALPVRLSLSNVWIKPSIISALLNQHAAAFSADFLGGSVSGSLSGALGSPTISVAWSNIDAATLARFPEVRALGISQGMFEGTATISAIDPAQPPNTTFSAALRDFSVPRNSFSSVLKLEPSDLVTISISGTSTPRSISLQPLSVTGFFGKLDSTGSIGVSGSGGITDVDLATAVELTPSGSQRFGQWLPLLTNNAVKAEASSFTIRSKTITCPSGGHPYTMQIGGRTLCFSNTVERSR